MTQRYTISRIYRRRPSSFFFLFFFLTAFRGYAQSSPCYEPIAGRDVVVTEVQGGTLCLNCTHINNTGALTDADPDNFAVFNPLNVSSGSGVSIRDTSGYFNAGWHAGYVVSFSNADLSASLFTAITLSTYRNGALQETKSHANGLSVSVLGEGTGLVYLSFPTTQDFDEVRFEFSSLTGVLTSFHVYYAMAFDPQCGLSDSNTICYDQIAGPSTRVGFNAGVTNALVTFSDAANLTDGNRNSYASLSLPAGVSLLADAPYVSVLDKELKYAAGSRVGFVVSYNAALLIADVLNHVSIETYLYGVLQETAQFTGGNGLLEIAALSAAGQGVRELSFTTSHAFNEVRLVVAQPASVNLGTLKIYYAFESGGGCSKGETPLTVAQPSPDDGSINSSRTGSFGTVCIGQSLSNTANVVNGSTTDYATFVPALLSVGCGASISVKNSGTDYPAGTIAGFVISKQGGLIDLGLLDAITLNLYKDNGAAPVASLSGSALLSIGLLNDNAGKSFIGFPSNAAFDEIQIVFNSGLISSGLGGSYRIYYAYVQRDSDNDGIPDENDICSGSDAYDSDGDGIPDACDNCTALNGKSVYRDTDGDGIADACDADADDDGIADAVEDRNNDGNVRNDDADGDGIANYLDLDSDDDGLADLYESGIVHSLLLSLDADSNAVIDPAVLRGANGMATIVETDDGVAATNNYLLADSDGDAAPDFVDLDTDNDGINDVMEGYAGLFADANSDGMVDGADSDRDGVKDLADGSPLWGTAPLGHPLDSDADAVPDYRDLDSDNDLISDLVENGQGGYTDADQDGMADGGDGDHDGIVGATDGDPAHFGDALQLQPVDTDNDGLPDYLDPDSDGDGTADIVEGGNGWQDLDGNGQVDNPTDPDSDGVANNHGDDRKPNDFGGLGTTTLLHIRLSLEGGFANGTDTLMRDDLRQAGLIPLQQPYQGSVNNRFAQTGGGNEATTSTVLAANPNSPNAIVDWMLLEFRKAGASSVVVRTANALLQRDGDIVGGDGNPMGVMIDTGNYFLSVKHRNHLGVMTANPVVVSGTPVTIDFTKVTTPLYGSTPVKLMPSGRRALIGGDVNSDGQVYYTAPGNDRDALLLMISSDPFNYLNIYSNGDVNLDGATYMTAPGNDRDWILSQPLTGDEFEYIQEQLP